jgi:hypothetical protein
VLIFLSLRPAGFRTDFGSLIGTVTALWPSVSSACGTETPKNDLAGGIGARLNAWPVKKLPGVDKTAPIKAHGGTRDDGR